MDYIKSGKIALLAALLILFSLDVLASPNYQLKQFMITGAVVTNIQPCVQSQGDAGYIVPDTSIYCSATNESGLPYDPYAGGYAFQVLDAPAELCPNTWYIITYTQGDGLDRNTEQVIPQAKLLWSLINLSYTYGQRLTLWMTIYSTFQPPAAMLPQVGRCDSSVTPNNLSVMIENVGLSN